MRLVAVASIPPHRFDRAALKDLAPGKTFISQMRKNGVFVFSAQGRARKPYRFVVFGDCGVATAVQKAVACQTHLARPNFMVIAGDVVYDRWPRVGESREFLAHRHCR
jgi:acid phosphatase type 7